MSYHALFCKDLMAQRAIKQIRGLNWTFHGKWRCCISTAESPLCVFVVPKNIQNKTLKSVVWPSWYKNERLLALCIIIIFIVILFYFLVQLLFLYTPKKRRSEIKMSTAKTQNSEAPLGGGIFRLYFNIFYFFIFISDRRFFGV